MPVPSMFLAPYDGISYEFGGEEVRFRKNGDSNYIQGTSQSALSFFRLSSGTREKFFSNECFEVDSNLGHDIPKLKSFVQSPLLF